MTNAFFSPSGVTADLFGLVTGGEKRKTLDNDLDMPIFRIIIIIIIKFTVAASNKERAQAPCAIATQAHQRHTVGTCT